MLTLYTEITERFPSVIIQVLRGGSPSKDWDARYMIKIIHRGQVMYSTQIGTNPEKLLLEVWSYITTNPVLFDA